MNKKNVEIVFTEIDLPHKDGITATKEALEKFPNLLIFGLSAHNNKSYISNLIKAGAKGYLLKSSNNYKQLKHIVNKPIRNLIFSDEIVFNTKPNTDSNKTILLVDDFETNVVVMKSSLQLHDFNVITTKDPLKGIEILKDPSNKIDIIVTDFRMPVMNGAEFVANARKIQSYKHIPILILSSETSQSKKDEARNAGASGWIKKPFKLETFLKIIKKFAN